MTSHQTKFPLMWIPMAADKVGEDDARAHFSPLRDLFRKTILARDTEAAHGFWILLNTNQYYSERKPNPLAKDGESI